MKLRSISWAALVLLLAAALAYQGATLVFTVPPVPTNNVIVFIPPHSTFSRAAHILSTAGVIESSKKLRVLARVTGKEGQLKPGEYEFVAPSPPYAVLQKLTEGDVIRHKVTFPEGITMVEVAKILDEAKLIDSERFGPLLRDRAFMKKVAIPGPSLEGFLFPDTYYFSRIEGEEKILQAMIGRFRQAITPEDETRSKTLGLDLLEWTTLASIIEKESSLPEEHRIVSSVFHNRLQKKMRLQSDPTVIYGIKNFDGNLTRKHLETPTPYNTYTNAGLPPGPIANPSASALHAAVNPDQTDFYYFVGDRKGRHVFAKTYAEHEQNVARYQLRRR